MKSTTSRSPERSSTPEPDSTESEYKKMIWKRIGLAGLTAVVLIGGTVAGLEMNYSNVVAARMPRNTYAIDPKIESVTIEAGARLREDPSVPGQGDPNNIIQTTGNSIEVEVHDPSEVAPNTPSVRVNPDSANGDWYGIPADVLKRVDPDLNPKGDSDGIIWVNEQKASVTRDSDTSSSK